jgi:hypothetical protein
MRRSSIGRRLEGFLRRELIEVNPLCVFDCRFDYGRQLGRGKTILRLRRRYKTLNAVHSAWHFFLHCRGLALLLFRSWRGDPMTLKCLVSLKQ